MQPLVVHPSCTTHTANFALEAGVTGHSDDALTLRYRLSGPLERLVIPASVSAPAQANFTTNLWEHTCFECFVRGDGADSYHELNFSPCGAWAAFAFAGYRDGAAMNPWPAAPTIERSDDGRTLELSATVALASMSDRYAKAGLSLALTTVLEHDDGSLSYWALEHPSDAPDFHHRDGFTLCV